MFGSIEAGGTKFVCAVARDDLEIIDRVSFPTRKPEETMAEVFAFFDRYQKELKAIGIGSFGPIDIRHDSNTYGYITNTPKYAWRFFDFVGAVKDQFNVPIAWTTDVNAAAYGEAHLGAGKSYESVAYYTIGTGFGGGLLMKEEFVQGYSHPEMGHALARRHPDDLYSGHCPNHGDCLEGMACGPAIEARTGRQGQDIPADDPFWDIEAYYIAQSAYNTFLYLSPEVIIYGGGVMEKDGLIDKVRYHFEKLLNDYLPTPDLDRYLVKPELGNNSAALGCILLAQNEFQLHIEL